MSRVSKERIGVVGLGYVGLPLATEFARKFAVVGYDRNQKRIQELQSGQDHTHEVDPEALKQKRLTFTADPRQLGDCTFIIVAVPTPINQAREPDLEPVVGASETVGRILKKGMLVSYESTVYPGVTEEVCLPILEKESGLKLGDFDLAYSPERVNPGDKEHRLPSIVKVVSGHDDKARARAAAVYGAIIRAGLHQAPNIKTAEASKVIENVQRDLNIALMNELSKIFRTLGIRTMDVLNAASTKWNFHPYRPGLVGGHCIGVDPYYLTHRALEKGYHPEVILAGRRINDTMGMYVADLMIRELSASGVCLAGAHVWVLGLSFKENVPDFRNTRAVDVITHLRGYGIRVSVWEPLVTPAQIRESFGYETVEPAGVKKAGIDGIILACGHRQFQGLDLAKLGRAMRTRNLVDVRNFFDPEKARAAGFRYTSL